MKYTKEQAEKLHTIFGWIAEGKVLQWNSNDGWKDDDPHDYCVEEFLKYEYRVKPETKYRPFNDADEAFQEAKKHGFFVKEKSTGFYIVITFVGGNFVSIGETDFDYKDLLDKFTWVDTDEPCGILN